MFGVRQIIQKTEHEKNMHPPKEIKHRFNLIGSVTIEQSCNCRGEKSCIGSNAVSDRYVRGILSEHRHHNEKNPTKDNRCVKAGMSAHIEPFGLRYISPE